VGFLGSGSPFSTRKPFFEILKNFFENFWLFISIDKIGVNTNEINETYYGSIPKAY